MKRHNDYYEYKTISFSFFKKVANRNDFKREWVTVRCQEDIMKQQPQNVQIRRLKKNVWQHNTMGSSIFIDRTCYRLLLTQEG